MKPVIFYTMSHKKIILTAIFLLMLIWCETSAKEISIESLLAKKLPEGWRQIGSPQVYNQKNLFNRINGQAELFFKYGFQKSVFVLYQNRSNSKDQIEVDLYDMGNVLQAFGIFSRFRSEDRSAGVGLESYLEDTSLLFYKGRYFVMLYAAEADSSILMRLARMISSEIPDSSPSPKEIDYFPKDGLKPGSIEYHPEGLLGYQFFKRGFQGVYLQKNQDKVQSKAKGEDKEYYLFLVIFKDSKELENALKTLRENLSKMVKIHSETPIPFGLKALKGEDSYRGKILMVPRGNFLFGAAGFEEDKVGEDALTEFIKNIK